jgi:hypothetical protein
MENKNSHNPLSAQELFNLIGNKSEQNTNAQDLDEFEKEALEGFEEYSTPVNAKKINEEINVAISQKISEQGSSTKNKIIWFSAAASIVLIIAISIFYFNDSNISSDSNIALNENNAKEIAPTQPIAPIDELKQEITPDVTAGTTVKDEKIKPFKTITEKEKTAESDITVSDTKGSVGRNQLEEVNGFKSVDDADAKPDTKTLTDNITNTASIELAKNKKESVAGKANESSENLSSSAGGVVKDKRKLDNAKDDEFDKVMSEKKSAVPSSAPSVSQAEVNAEGITANSKAYYVGEETGIKNYIISIAKKDNSDSVLKGKYKINVSVNINGSINLNSIINTTDDCKDCAKIMTKILKDMKNWNPEIKNGKAIQSSKDFVLEF